MKIFNLKELEDDNEQNIEYEQLTEEEIKKQFPSFTSIKLADIIIAHKYIGLYKTLSIEAMKELSKRRTHGDDFQYESYIADKIKELPKIDFTIPQISSLLDKIKIFKK